LAFHELREDGKVEAQFLRSEDNEELTVERIILYPTKLLEKFKTQIREGQLYVRCNWERTIDETTAK
jgi:hypothetical protein